MKRALAAVAVVVLSVVGVFSLAPASSIVNVAEVPVPSCAKPTATSSQQQNHQKMYDYAQCLAERQEALGGNLHPVPTATVTVTETATSSPTPSTSPSPTPAPAAAFPTRTSVGPATEPTQPYAGDCYFDASESGAVIDARVLDCDSAGGVRFAVDATGIVFRNSVIRGQMFTVGNTPGDPGAEQEARAPVFTVEDSRVIQSSTVDWQDRAACCSHYVIKRSLIQGTHSGIGAHNNVELTGNFITTDGTDSHSSGVRVLKNTILRGNTITCKPVTAGSDGGCSAAGVFYSEDLGGNPAAAYNLTIDGNYFRRGVTKGGEPGGPWNATRFINCANRTDCTGIKFTGNQFDLGWQTDGGEFPFYGNNEWANNTWVDGQTATSGQSR